MRRLLLFLSILLLTTFTHAGQLKPPKGMQLIRGHMLGPAGGLVAHYVMNEGTGNTVFDLSGNRNPGTFSGNVSWQQGKFGHAIDFPGGANDFINVGNIGDLGTHWTIVTWINTDTISSNLVIASKRGSKIEFQLDHNNADVRLIIRDDASTTITATYANILTVGTWYQVVGCREGNTACVYVNAVRGTDDTDTLGALAPDGNFVIGEFGNAEFNGKIDNVLLFNRALSASEIALLSREPFVMFKADNHLLYAGEVAAPAGGGQVIFISTIPIFIGVGLVLAFSKGKKAA